MKLTVILILSLNSISCHLFDGSGSSAISPLKEYKIAYSRTSASGVGKVYVVSPSYRSPSLLADSLILTDSTLSWSPDGNNILFVSKGQIHSIKVDGTNRTRLTMNDSTNSSPSWSPEGLRIAYQSKATGTFQVFLMNRDGSSQRQLTHNSNGARLPAWSPDGGQIAYMGDGGIHVVDLFSGSDLQLTVYPDDYRPVWYPLGGKILFRSTRDGNQEIYVMNADGTQQVNLTNSPANEDDHSWSPSGTEIAFTTDADSYYDDRYGLIYLRKELVVMRSDGTDRRQLTTNSIVSTSAWSPDSKLIVFVDSMGGPGLFTTDDVFVDRRTVLAAGYAPVWSPVPLE